MRERRPLPDERCHEFVRNVLIRRSFLRAEVERIRRTVAVGRPVIQELAPGIVRQDRKPAGEPLVHRELQSVIGRIAHADLIGDAAVIRRVDPAGIHGLAGRSENGWVLLRLQEQVIAFVADIASRGHPGSEELMLDGQVPLLHDGVAEVRIPLRHVQRQQELVRGGLLRRRGLLERERIAGIGIRIVRARRMAAWR